MSGSPLGHHLDTRIAIVGMACRFPGGAHDPEAFWKLLSERLCTMETVPPSRFKIADYWSKDGDEVNKMMARQGHFLTEGLCFDEAFFNLAPRQALNTDPQHRVLLETVVDALDDAGYRPTHDGGEAGWDRSRMGIFVGSSVDSYQNNLASNIDAFFCPGMIRGFASGRVSHYFQWQGPSIVYDTACSSGLVAVHAACQSLLLRECDAAVAAGTNMITSPEMSIALSKGFFISNTGGCRTFDETGDGYCRAEAVGGLILKRLEDALRDNDKIDAVILASGINQSGPAESLTKPHAPSQAALFVANCERAGISPLAVRAVEAHGTGTQAGDHAEMDAIKAAFTSGRPPVVAGEEGPAKGTQLFVSALKPNVGHSESTSGIASVIKATLMMRHKEVVPHIGITTRRNPRLGDIEAHGIVIPTRSQPLTPVMGQDKIVISVNNFGAPGGNANVLLQESLYGHSRTGADLRSHHIVTLSGKMHTPFETLVDRFLDHLEKNPDVDLASLSYTTTARRVDYPARVAFSVSSIEDLKQRLKKSLAPTTQQSKTALKIGFVVGGNGSQFKGMGKTLYETSPSFKKHIDVCDAALTAAGGSGLLSVIHGELDPLSQNYESMLGAAAAMFAVEYALGQLWHEWGVVPSVIIGHSMGEFAGLVLAGAMSVEDAMKLVVAKIQSVQTQAVEKLGGGMLAIGASPEQVKIFIAASGCSGAEVACFNGPAQTAVSGPKVQLENLKAYLQGLPDAPLAKILPGHLAWHSTHMSLPAAQLAAAADAITPTPATTPMILNVDGTALAPGDVLQREYLAEQMELPVRWDLCASHPLSQEVDIWIELSAKSILLPLLRPFVPSGKTFLPTINGPTVDSWSTITRALARLFEAHVPVNWAAYHAHCPVHLVPLPRYPFARNEHYMPYVDRLFVVPRTAALLPAAATVSTPVGKLDIVEPWKRFVLEVAEPLAPETFVWLAASCTQGTTGVRELHVAGAARTSDRVAVVVDRGTVAFTDLATGAELASCAVTTEARRLAANHYLVRGRERLARDAAASVLPGNIVARMLGERAADSSIMVLAGEGDEGVCTLAWNAVSPLVHAGVSGVPFAPAQLHAAMQAARMLLYLAGAPAEVRDVAAIEFAGDWSVVRAVSVHVVANATGVDAYLYAGNQPLARISKYGRLGAEDIEKPPSASPTTKYPPTPAPTPSTENQAFIVAPSTGGEQVQKAVRTTFPELIPPPARKVLTQQTMTALLATELGIPTQSISPSDGLEDLGVDSIMSLLMRDRVSEMSGGRLGWFVWRKGMTVQDLWNYVAAAVE